MKLKQKEFASAAKVLAKLAKTAPETTRRPIEVRASGDHIILEANNLSTFARVEIGRTDDYYDAFEPIAVDAQQLARVAPPSSRRGEPIIEIDRKGEEIELTDKDGPITLTSVIGIDYLPQLPDLAYRYDAETWNTGDAVDDLAHLLPAVGTDDLRPHLHGVMLRQDGAYTTDGHRLHFVKRHFFDQETEAVIETASAEAIAAVAKTEVGTIKISSAEDSDQTWIRFECGPWTIATRSLDVEFPPVDAVISDLMVRDAADAFFDFDPKLMVPRLKKLARVSSDYHQGIKIEAKAFANEIKVSLGGSTPASTSIPTAGVGSATVGLRLRYLQQAIDTVGEGEILVNGALDPVRFVGTSARQAIVMPIRL